MHRGSPSGAYLSELRALLGERLHSDRQVVRLSRGPGLLIDLDEIAPALRGGELSAVEQAAALPRGVLLEGLGGDSLELDDWLSRERPRWQRSISQLLATTLLRDPRRGRSVGRAENMTSRSTFAQRHLELALLCLAVVSEPRG